MAEVTKQPPPEPVVQVQPSPQQTAATLAPIAAQPATAQGAAQEESSWFDDAGKTALAIGGFVGDRLKAGLEAGMDESKVLRLVGGILGAESPSMRRAGLQEDLLNQNLELGKLRLAEAKAQSIRNANADQWNEEVRNRQRAVWKQQDEETARKSAVNEAATGKALYGAYEGEAAQQVWSEARDEYFALANREADTVLRTTNQFTPDPQVFEAMKGSRAVQEATTTRAVLAMLDSKNPLVQQSAVATAKQYGIELSQREGKWFMQLPNGDGEFELNERNRKGITAQLVWDIVTEAQAKTRLKQWEQHAVSNGFLVAANRLRNEAGVGDAKDQEAKIAAIARAIPQADLELYGALNTLKQLYDGGLKKEEIPVMEAQLEQLAAKFGIEHNGGDGGVFLIEGKNPVKYAEERLRQNPFQQALDREIQTRKAEGVRRLAQLAAEAAAKKGAGTTPGGEGDADAQAQAQFQETVESGQKLAKEMGVPEGFIENSVANHNQGEEDDEKKFTVAKGYDVFRQAVQTFASSVSDGKSGERAYKDVVDLYKDYHFTESDVPAVFRRRGREIDLEAARGKTKELAKNVTTAREKYRKDFQAAKERYEKTHLPSDNPDETYGVSSYPLISAQKAYDDNIARITELRQQQIEEERQTAQQQAHNERFDQALRKLKGEKPKKPKQKKQKPQGGRK